MKVNLKKRFIALAMAGMMLTSNTLPAYSATETTASEASQAAESTAKGGDSSSASSEKSELGGASTEHKNEAEAAEEIVKEAADASNTEAAEEANAGAESGATTAEDEKNRGESTPESGETETAGEEKETSDESAADSEGEHIDETKADTAESVGTDESKEGTSGSGASRVTASGVGSEAGESGAAEESKEETAAAEEIGESKAADAMEEITPATPSEIQEEDPRLAYKENRKTIYIAFGKGVKVTATLEHADAVPDDARLRVTELEDGALYDAYIAAMDEADPDVKHTKDNTVVRDISFIMKDEDGEEIEYEPTEGSVKLSIEYLGDHLKEKLGVDDIADVKTYHLPLTEGVKAEGEKTIDVQNVSAADIDVQELEAEVENEKTVEVQVDSFSVFVMTQAASAAAESSIDLNTAVRTVSVIKVNDQPFDSSKAYPRDATFEFKMKYQFPENKKPTAGGIQSASYTLPSVLNVSNASGNILCEGYTAGPAGTYEIVGGKVTFHYTTEFLQARPNNIGGTFTFEGKLSEQSTVDQEKITIDFGTDGTNIPIEIKFEEGKVNAGKSYTLNEDGTIDFEIKLNVTGKGVNNLVVTDRQGRNLKFADNNFTLDGIAIDSSKVRISENNFDKDNVEPTSAIINIGTLAIGEHTLKYKAEPRFKTTTDGDPNKNSAYCEWTGGNCNTETTVTPDTQLHKKGQVDENENLITWSVYYWPGKWGSVAEKTFTDTLGENQEYSGDYKVFYDPNGNGWYASEEHEIASGALPTTGTTFSYTFPSDMTGKGTYKIVYKTKITKDLSTSTTKETFTNSISGDGKEASGTVEVDNTPKPIHYDVVRKEGKANSLDRKATWTITITPPSGKEIKELHLTDSLQDIENWQGKYLLDGLTVKKGESILKLNEDYTVSPSSANSSIEIEFLKPITETITITYQSDYSSKPDQIGWTGNNITASYEIDGKNYTEDDSSSVEFKTTDFTLNKTGELAGGIARWKVTINEREGWKRAELSDDVKNIVDTIPEGMEYVDGSLKCSIEATRYNSPLKPYTDVVATFDPESRKLNISIRNLDLTNDRCVYIELEYQTRVTNGNKASFTNHVQVGSKSDDATVSINSKKLDKSGSLAEGVPNVVEYRIGVNYGAEKLVSGDTLTLNDVLDSNLTLDVSSIKVTDMKTGEAVAYKASFGTTQGQNTMTLTIPDQRALVVSYRASLVTAGKTENTTYTVSNKASLTGAEQVTVGTSTEVKYEKTSATVEGSANSITIQKVDDEGKKLAGAQFVVQKVKPSDLSVDGSAITLTTDKSGVAKFENLKLNTLYYYQEMEAPAGYAIKDSAKHYFVIKDTANEAGYTQLTQGIKSGTEYATLSGGNTFIVENVPEKTSVEVTKTWDDAGHESERPDKIKVNLLADGKQIKSHEVTSAENWKYTFEDLNKYKKDGSEIEYTVTEEGVANYTTEVNGYTIKNTYTPTEPTTENETKPTTPETTVPETTTPETTKPTSGGGGGGGNHPHPTPETTPASTTPAETTVPETSPVETTVPESTNPGGSNGGQHPSEEVETDEFGNVLGAGRGRKKSGDGNEDGSTKGASRGKTRTGDESRMSIFGLGFIASVLVLLGWISIRDIKRRHE